MYIDVLCVHICIYICIYTRVYIYIYMLYTYMSLYKSLYLYIYLYMYIIGCVCFVSVKAKQLRSPIKSTMQLFYILPYGLRIILCVRAHHITEPTWVGLGPIEPRARDQGPRPKKLLW